MNFAYLFRLACLCLASFFIIQAALSLAARALLPAAIHFAERLRPRVAARLLLALRLLPAGLAILAVITLCLPSYLWFEPEARAEEIGLVCALAALLGAALWTLSLVRVLRAAAISSRRTREWRRAGEVLHFHAEVPDMLVIEDEAPILALSGLFHSRLIASRGILRRLSSDQLNAALRHENAHHASRDNLKRLMLLLAPDAIPFLRSFAPLERAWSRFTEWAADDSAVAGDAQRSLSLAEALVCVSRMGSAPRLSPFVSTLAPDDGDLSARVNRLLHPALLPETSRRRMQIFVAGATLAVGAMLTVALLQPATFYTIHRLLEHLIR